MNIDIAKYTELPRAAEISVLLDLLQEVGANIYNCTELFKLYWIPKMAQEANEYIALAEKIKSRILSIFLIGWSKRDETGKGGRKFY